MRAALRSIRKYGGKLTTQSHTFADRHIPVRRWISLALVVQPGGLLSTRGDQVHLFIDGRKEETCFVSVPSLREPLARAVIGAGCTPPQTTHTAPLRPCSQRPRMTRVAVLVEADDQWEPWVQQLRLAMPW